MTIKKQRIFSVIILVQLVVLIFLVSTYTKYSFVGKPSEIADHLVFSGLVAMCFTIPYVMALATEMVSKEKVKKLPK